MLYTMPIVFFSAAVAAAAPILLHGHPTRDCNPRNELCALSEMAYLPDEPAPKNAPVPIYAQAVAAVTGSTRTVNLIADDLMTAPAVLGQPPLTLT
jgi:hypothetical protein